MFFHQDNAPAEILLVVRYFLAKNNAVILLEEKCLDEWKNHWHNSIISERDYFEDDKNILMAKRIFFENNKLS